MSFEKNSLKKKNEKNSRLKKSFRILSFGKRFVIIIFFFRERQDSITEFYLVIRGTIVNFIQPR